MKTPIKILEAMEAVRASGVTNMMDAKRVIIEMIENDIDEAIEHFLVRKSSRGHDRITIDYNSYLDALNDLAEYRYSQEHEGLA
jgi:hypothetical protein